MNRLYEYIYDAPPCVYDYPSISDPVKLILKLIRHRDYEQLLCHLPMGSLGLMFQYSNEMGIDMVGILEYLHQRGYSLDDSCILMAVQNSQYQSIRYIVEHGDDQIQEWIARCRSSWCEGLTVQVIHGNIDCVRYLREVLHFEWDHTVLLEAASLGRLDCLQYLDQAGCKPDTHVNLLLHVVEGGDHLECLHYLCERYGCSSSQVAMMAAKHHRWACLEYLIVSGYPFSIKDCIRADPGRRSVKKFFRDLGMM